jgi:hypothetical protein
MFLNLRVQLQEDGCTYNYGLIRLTCIIMTGVHIPEAHTKYHNITVHTAAFLKVKPRA